MYMLTCAAFLSFFIFFYRVNKNSVVLLLLSFDILS